jgi:hypothetical protein
MGSFACSSRCAPGSTLKDGLCVRPSADSPQVPVSGENGASSMAGGASGAPGAQRSAGTPMSSGGVGGTLESGLAPVMSGAGTIGSALPQPAEQAPSPGAVPPMADSPPTSEFDAGAASIPNDMANAEPGCAPTEETCDGQDNDCDARVDEDLPPLPCGIDMGTCQPGTIECRSGSWEDPDTQCRGAVAPQPTDVCDGLDNDCDGSIDNGADSLCGSNAVCMGTSGCHECDDGFRKQSGQCVDVDECRTGNPCGPNADCRNTTGSHECRCRMGFEQQGEQCIAIDYCDSNPCDNNASCRSVGGRAQCMCNSGFSGSGTPGTCKVDYLSSCSQDSECQSGGVCNGYCTKNCTGTLTSCDTGDSSFPGACLFDTTCVPKCGDCELRYPDAMGADRYYCTPNRSCPRTAPRCISPDLTSGSLEHAVKFCGN